MTNPHIIETGADDTPRMGKEFERLLRLRRQGEINDEDMVVGLVEQGKKMERELARYEKRLGDGQSPNDAGQSPNDEGQMPGNKSNGP